MLGQMTTSCVVILKLCDAMYGDQLAVKFGIYWVHYLMGTTQQRVLKSATTNVVG